MKDFFRKLKNKLFGRYERVVDFTGSIPAHDVRASKVSAIFAYIFFFVPLIFCEERQFGRFHANQSLVNLLLSTLGAVLLSFIPYAGPFLMIAQEALCLVWAVRGMILAARGKAVSIPFVGWITLLAYRMSGQE